MFCYKCGQKVPADAVFCSKCGTKLVHQAENDVVSSSSSSKELDRDALAVYLSDVLSLECTKFSLDKQVLDLNYEISSTQNNNHYISFEYGEGCRRFHLFYDGTDYYVAVSENGNRMYYQTNLSTRPDFRYYWMPIESNMEYLQSSYPWEYVEGGCYGFFATRSHRSAARSYFFEVYNKFKYSAPSKFKENEAKIHQLSNKAFALNQYLLDVNELLSQAYSLNIIPEPFRHKLYAIYYLYTFITTSNESFSSALLHYDLDEIKAKLDEIIQNQCDIIMQQAVISAQNNELISQNQNQLAQLSKIERNTKFAAQYSQIAANNSRICAWFSVANYLHS